MTKLEMAIHSVEWKIEETEKEYREARASLTRDLTSDSTFILNPVFIKQYADRMDRAYKALETLREQLNVLNHLAD